MRSVGRGTCTHLRSPCPASNKWLAVVLGEHHGHQRRAAAHATRGGERLSPPSTSAACPLCCTIWSSHFSTSFWLPAWGERGARSVGSAAQRSSRCCPALERRHVRAPAAVQPAQRCLACGTCSARPASPSPLLRGGGHAERSTEALAAAAEQARGAQLAGPADQGEPGPAGLSHGHCAGRGACRPLPDPPPTLCGAQVSAGRRGTGGGAGGRGGARRRSTPSMRMVGLFVCFLAG